MLTKQRLDAQLEPSLPLRFRFGGEFDRTACPLEPEPTFLLDLGGFTLIDSALPYKGSLRFPLPALREFPHFSSSGLFFSFVIGRLP